MLKTKFGIEVEFTGITRTKASRIIEKHFGGKLTKLGGSYDNRKYTKLEKTLEIFIIVC